jgi:hypothetical protein
MRLGRQRYDRVNSFIKYFLVAEKEVRSPLLHFKKQAQLPYQVGKAGTARRAFLDSVLIGNISGLENALQDK